MAEGAYAAMISIPKSKYFVKKSSIARPWFFINSQQKKVEGFFDNIMS